MLSEFLWGNVGKIKMWETGLGDWGTWLGNVVGEMWKMGMGNRGTWLVKCGKRGWATGERGWEIAGNVG